MQLISFAVIISVVFGRVCLALPEPAGTVLGTITEFSPSTPLLDVSDYMPDVPLPLTITARMRSETMTPPAPILSSATDSNTVCAELVVWPEEGMLGLQMGTAVCTSGSFGSGLLGDGAWHAIAIVANPTSCEFFVDGTSIATAAVVFPGSSTTCGGESFSQTYLGRTALSLGGLPTKYDGLLSDINVYDSALSAADLATLTPQQVTLTWETGDVTNAGSEDDVDIVFLSEDLSGSCQESEVFTITGGFDRATESSQTFSVGNSAPVNGIRLLATGPDGWFFSKLRVTTSFLGQSRTWNAAAHRWLDNGLAPQPRPLGPQAEEWLLWEFHTESLASSYSEQATTTGVSWTDSTDLELPVDSAPQTVGIRFYYGTGVPRRAVITNAYIQFVSDEISDRTNPILLINAEAHTNPDPFNTNIAFDLDRRTKTYASAIWSPVSWDDKHRADAAQATVDLTDIFQELVSQPGWTPESPVNVFLSRHSSDADPTSVRVAESGKVGPHTAPRLYISYRQRLATEIVASNPAWSEEAVLSGAVNLDSTDLEMPREANEQTVGLLFDDVPIGSGNDVVYSYLQFQADELDAGTLQLAIRGEGVTGGQPSTAVAPFSGDTFNLSDRATTSSRVLWSPRPWQIVGERGPNQQTPNLANVVTEQRATRDGNSLAFFIGRSTSDFTLNTRVAESGLNGGGPELHVLIAPTDPFLREGSGCDDVAGFLDADGNTCARWTGHDCGLPLPGSAPMSATDVNMLKANCPRSCGLCVEPLGVHVCADSNSFRDVWGRTCGDWAATPQSPPCSSSITGFPYVPRELEAVRAACPDACGICASRSASPTISITASPSRTPTASPSPSPTLSFSASKSPGIPASPSPTPSVSSTVDLQSQWRDFDGNSWEDAATHPAFEHQLSVSGCVRQTSGNSGVLLDSADAAGRSCLSIVLDGDSDRILLHYLQGSTPRTIYSSAGTGLDDGSTHRVAVAVNGRSVTFYVDGSRVGDVKQIESGTYFRMCTSDTRIGLATDDSHGMDGSIGNVVLHSWSLTSSQANALTCPAYSSTPASNSMPNRMEFVGSSWLPFTTSSSVDGSSLVTTNAAAPLTLSACLRTTTTSPFYAIANTRNSAGSVRCYSLYVVPSNRQMILNYAASPSAGSHSFLSSDNPSGSFISDGQPHNIQVVIAADNSVRFYLDGVQYGGTKQLPGGTDIRLCPASSGGVTFVGKRAPNNLHYVGDMRSVVIAQQDTPVAVTCSDVSPIAGLVQAATDTSLTTTHPTSRNVRFYKADFGISLNGALLGTMVVASPANGCSTISILDVKNPIVIIDRGGCSFVQKVQNAQTAGAIAVVVANTDEELRVMLPPSGDFSNLIPSVLVKLSDGVALKADVGASCGLQARLAIKDNAGPVAAVTVLGGSSNINVGDAVIIAVLWNEPVEGFTSSDVTATNGAVTGFSATDPGTSYLVTVTASATGTMKLSVPSRVCVDRVGNPNAANSASVTVV